MFSSVCEGAIRIVKYMQDNNINIVRNYYRRAGSNLSREKTFVDCLLVPLTVHGAFKHLWIKLSQIGKYKAAKFAKGLSLKSVPLYGIILGIAISLIV